MALILILYAIKSVHVRRWPVLCVTFVYKTVNSDLHNTAHKTQPRKTMPIRRTLLYL